MITITLTAIYFFVAGAMTVMMADDRKYFILVGIFWLPYFILESIFMWLHKFISYLSSKSTFIDFAYAWIAFIWLRKFNPMPMRGIKFLLDSEKYKTNQLHKKITDKLVKIYDYSPDKISEC
jgi:hypothetical protein